MIDENTRERIQKEVGSTDVLLFMKGTPVFPQCGFSAAVIQVLSHLQVKFNSVNVLEDMDIREGIKHYSDWPTIPQLYVKGEFVGGCDIVKEMYESGELKKIFDDKGINYKK